MNREEIANNQLSDIADSKEKDLLDHKEFLEKELE